MVQPTCEIEGITAVLVGRFNPAILQPAWLAYHGLVRPSEADLASIEIIRPEITSYRVGPFNVSAIPERVSFEVADAGHAALLRDLVVSVFSRLVETPVTQLGINRQMHFRVASEAEWHQIGHTLVPKKPFEGLVDDPGTMRVAVRGKRPGGQSKRLQVTIEPSVRVIPGIYVAVNDHYEVAEEQGTMSRVLELLQDEWDPSLEHARRLGEGIVANCARAS